MDILFVGPGEHIPADLAELISSLDEDWRVHHAGDVAEAMQIVASVALDATIASPRIDGSGAAGLFAQIRILRPEAVRIALLDADGAAPAPRLVGLAHRFLPMPASAEVVVEAIHSLIDLHELLDNEHLKRTIGRVDRLPSPPHLYFALTRALTDDDVSASEVARLIGSDPAIAAKVLQLCNSAFYSGGRSFSDLRAAVTRLGFAALRDLVLASEVFSLPSTQTISRQALQQRALLASRLAAKLLPASCAELGATAALLADIGLLLPGVRDERDPGTADNGEPGHSEAGAYLLGLWGLPMPIVEAVAFHRQPQRASVRSFWVPGAVHVASALAGGETVDEAYLASVGVAARLPEWRKQVESLATA